MKKQPINQSKIPKMYKEALCYAIGLSILQGYIDISTSVKGVEIENYFETQVKRNKVVNSFTKKEKKDIWVCFINHLFLYRKNRRIRENHQ